MIWFHMEQKLKLIPVGSESPLSLCEVARESPAEVQPLPPWWLPVPRPGTEEPPSCQGPTGKAHGLGSAWVPGEKRKRCDTFWLVPPNILDVLSHQFEIFRYRPQKVKVIPKISNRSLFLLKVTRPYTFRQLQNTQCYPSAWVISYFLCFYNKCGIFWGIGNRVLNKIVRFLCLWVFRFYH